MSDGPCRVLLVRLSAMGDVVESLGAVRALQLARPEWSLSLVVQRVIAPLLDGWPGLDVVRHERAAGWRGLWRTGRALREKGFDVALDLQGNWKSAALARLSGAGVRLGIHRSRRQEPASWRLLTSEVGDALAATGTEGRHPGTVALEVVRTLAEDAEVAAIPWRVTDDELQRERAALQAVGVDPARPFAVFVWTDPADNRAWRPEAMVRATAGSALPVVWLAGPAEAHLSGAAAPVLRHGAGEVRRLLAIGQLVRDVRGYVVGPDQGATHVLTAAGAQVQVLFGPQDPQATAPVGAQVVHVPEPPACMPCRSRHCSHAEGPVCMEQLLAPPRVPWHAGGA